NSLESAEDVEISLAKDGSAYSVCEASAVTGKMNAHNTFEAPDVVKEEAFTAYSKTSNGIKVTLPACSVVSVRLKK
ncbi:MAG: alpha-N-arabinofuranosidase, partial [Lachnospiraceae bacterium]|nr:alpha-N-arabinofuranosidase [Lachnospiraceae bacterium]